MLTKICDVQNLKKKTSKNGKAPGVDEIPFEMYLF